MKFLLDESAEIKIARYLENEGHDVSVVQRDFPVGLPDHQLLARANSEARILITNDRDFGELVIRHRQPHAGVIYFRLPKDSTATEKIDRLTELLSRRRQDLGRFIVVSAKGIRVR